MFMLAYATIAMAVEWIQQTEFNRETALKILLEYYMETSRREKAVTLFLICESSENLLCYSLK